VGTSFERGSRIVVRWNGQRVGGRISRVLSAWRYRVVTDGNRRLEVSRRDCEPGRPQLRRWRTTSFSSVISSTA
jgi:hypothetical protein